MNWLDFFSALIGHLAWPITVVLIIFLLRKPIIELIPALQKLRFKEFELEFREKIQQAKPKLVKNKDEATLKRKEVNLLKERDYYFNLVGVSPRQAIIESWMEVEAAATEAYTKLVSPGMKVFMNPRDIFQYLRVNDYLENDEFEISDNLRILGNKSAHMKDIQEMDESLVFEYVSLALDLAVSVREKLPKQDTGHDSDKLPSSE